MDNPIILKGKKRVFTEAVQEVCDTQNLPMPEINFDGCHYEGGGDELAHSHPEQYMICISERQLKVQNSEGLRETAYHEMTHLIGLIEHGHKFENKKNELISKGWRPRKGSGVHFISGDQINEESKRIREDPERLAWVNEDSDLIKYLEGKTNHPENKTSISNSEKPEEKAISPDKLVTKYNPMTKEDIQKTRDKLGIKTEYEARCKMPLCHRPVSSKCEYCFENFCKFHLNCLIATTKEEIELLSNDDDKEKYEKYIEDYETKNGHPCINYTRQWNDNRTPVIEDDPKRLGFFGRLKKVLGITNEGEDI